jgi:hypothetical protein
MRWRVLISIDGEPEIVPRVRAGISRVGLREEG